MKRPAAVCGFTIYLTSFFLCGGSVRRILFTLSAFFALFFIVFPIFALSRRRLLGLTLVLTIAVSGALSSTAVLIRYMTSYQPVLSYVSRESSFIEGVVLDCGGLENRRYTYILKAEKIGAHDANCKFRFTSREDLYIKPGDRISANIASVNLLGKGQYERYYLSEGTYIGGWYADSLKIIGKAEKNFRIFFSSLRYQLKNQILKILPSDSGGLLCGIVLGDESAMSVRAQNSMIRSGINHIFSVSGVHVSVWSLIPFYFLSFLGIKKRQRAIICSLLPLLVCAITGFPPSALRAALMLYPVYLGSVLRLQGDMLNSLGAALTLICLGNPFIGGSISLLLSAAATIGIILSLEFFMPKIQKMIFITLGKTISAKLFQSIFSALFLSIIISGTLLPITVFQFGYISLLAPLANLLLVPLTETAMFIGGIGAMLKNSFLIKTAGRFCSLSLRGADFLASSSMSIVPANGKILICAFCCILLVFLFCLILKNKRFGVTFFVLLLSVTSTALSVFFQFSQMKQTEIQIAPSEKILLSISSHGREILVAPYFTAQEAGYLLDEKNIYTLDLLLLTDTEKMPYWAKDYAPRKFIQTKKAQSITLGDMQMQFSENGKICRMTNGKKKVLILLDEINPPENETADLLILSNTANKSIHPGLYGDMIISSELDEITSFPLS